MAIYRESGAAVAISAGKESAYGTAATMNRLLFCNSAPTPITANNFDKSGLSNGLEESAGSTILNFQTALSLSGPACSHSLPILMAYALGADNKSVVDTSGVQHLITPYGVSTENPSGTMQVNPAGSGSTTAAVKYPGVFVDSLTISGTDGGSWSWSANILTNGGSVSAADISGATAPAYFPFNFSGCQFKVVATPQTTLAVDAPTSGVVATGGWTPVDLSAYVQSVTYTLQNSARRSYTKNADGTAHTAFRLNRKQTLSVTMRHESGVAALSLLANMGLTGVSAGAAADYSALVYQTGNVLCGAATYDYGFAFYHPLLIVKSVTPPSGTPRTFTVNFDICDPQVTSPATLYSTHFVAWNADNVFYAA